MRVLDFLTHPPYQYNLCKTGHRFSFAPSHIYQAWDEALRPLPPNAQVVSPDLDPADFDVVIAATRQQYHTVRGRVSSRRIVFISHTILHPWDREFFAALPEEVEIVYVSDHKRATFGEIGRRGGTIPLAVDTENEFTGHTGEKAVVLNVTNRYAQQGDRAYPLFEGLLNDAEVPAKAGLAGGRSWASTSRSTHSCPGRTRCLRSTPTTGNLGGPGLRSAPGQPPTCGSPSTR